MYKWICGDDLSSSAEKMAKMLARIGRHKIAFQLVYLENPYLNGSFQRYDLLVENFYDKNHELICGMSGQPICEVMTNQWQLKEQRPGWYIALNNLN